MIVRKPGQPKADLSEETTAEVLKKAKALIRTDWGGQNPDQAIFRKLLAAGMEASPQLVAACLAIAEQQVAGCRRRTSRRLNEAIRRLETGPAAKKAP